MIESDNHKQHKFVKTKISKVTICKICGKHIRGILNSEGYTCTVCSTTVHKACYIQARRNRCQEAELANQFSPLLPIIQENCLRNFQRFIYQAQNENFDFKKKQKAFVDDILNAQSLDQSIAQKMEKIWSSKAIRETYKEKSDKWQITENSDYFFDHIIRIGSPEYIPNTQDLLRTKNTELDEKKKDYKNRVFTVRLPKNSKMEFVHKPDLNVDDILKKVKDAHQGTENYIAWDENGTNLSNLGGKLSLGKLDMLQIYYLPEGQLPPTSGRHSSTRDSKKKRRLSNPRASSALKASSPKKRDSKYLANSSQSEQTLERRNGVFLITVVDAQNLASNSSNFEDLYVVVSESNAGKRFKTQPVPNTSLPVWNHNIKFHTNFSQLEFTAKVWATSKNDLIADQCIGQAMLSVSNFKDGDVGEEYLTLKKIPKKYKSSKLKSTIKIKWIYNDKKIKKDIFSPIKQPVIFVQPEKVTTAKEITLSKPELPDKIQNLYEFGDILGEGAFSIVKKAVRKKDGLEVAIKILDNYKNFEDAEEDLQRFQQELEIIKSLDHKGIIKFLDFFEDDEHFYVVLELVQGGELFDEIVEKGFIEEPESAVLISQLLNAMCFLEENHICHRDLKPENIMFTDKTRKNIKLIDFGEARSCAEGKLNDYAGTKDYMSPEVIKGSAYDTRVDMWSLGVITYVMLCGFPPWEGETESDIFVNIMLMQYSFPSPEWDKISEEAKDFIRTLLQEHDNRMTAKEAKNHPWLKKYTSPPIVEITFKMPSDTFSSEILEIIKKKIEEALSVKGNKQEQIDQNGFTTSIIHFNKN